MVVTIAMFSRASRSLWFLIFACTLVFELVPLSLPFEAGFSPLLFHSYESVKVLAFLIFGFLTPITWWHYKNLGMGLVFATVITAMVELGQAVIPGHRASTLELGVKLIVFVVGFVYGLDVRHDQQVSAGPVKVRFSSRYWSERF
jgi:hypothetical protein